MALDDKHPLYKSNERMWRFYDLSYVPNDISTATSPLNGQPYVTRYRLEAQQDYQARIQKAFPFDVCSVGVDLVSGSIEDIEIQVPDALQPLLDDADLQSTSFLQLMLDARKKAAVFGHVFLLVDSTRATTTINTQAEAIAANIRPFVRILTPLQVINWRLDEAGNLKELVYTLQPEPQASLLDAETEPVTQYRYWSRTEWRVYESKGDDRTPTLVDQGINPIGHVPVAVLYHKKRQPMLGESLIRQAARCQQTLTNWFSSLDSIQERQSFAQPVLISRSKPSEVGVGASVVLHLSPSTKDSNGDDLGSEDFKYVAPDSAPLKLAWDSLDRVRSLAYTSMSLPDEIFNEQGGQPASGVSKAYSFRSLDKRLQQVALNEQEAVKLALFLAALWYGASGDIVVRYPSTFDLSSLEDSITNLISLQAAQVPPTAQRELKRAAIVKALPRLDPIVLEQINTELETAPAI